MNKGINIETAQQILKDANRQGIYNHLYLIYNFPTETMDDFMETINFIHNNKNIINSFIFHRFNITISTYIYNHPEEFSIDPKLIKNTEYIFYDEICEDKELFAKKEKIKDDINKQYIELVPDLVLYIASNTIVLGIMDRIPLKYLKLFYVKYKIQKYFRNKKLYLMKKFKK